MARPVQIDPSAASPSGSTTRLLTIPNIISFVRLTTVPIFVWLFVSGRENAAVVLYIAGASTDFLDGYIARRTNSVSELGKLLDPLADRIFIAALVIALVVRETMPLWVAIAIVGRDLLVLSLFPYLERRKIQRIAVNKVGKTATAALFTGLSMLALSETTLPGSEMLASVGLAVALIGAALYWAAGYLYAREAIAKLQTLKETSR